MVEIHGWTETDSTRALRSWQSGTQSALTHQKGLPEASSSLTGFLSPCKHHFWPVPKGRWEKQDKPQRPSVQWGTGPRPKSHIRVVGSLPWLEGGEKLFLFCFHWCWNTLSYSVYNSIQMPCLGLSFYKIWLTFNQTITNPFWEPIKCHTLCGTLPVFCV